MLVLERSRIKLSVVVQIKMNNVDRHWTLVGKVAFEYLVVIRVMGIRVRGYFHNANI